MPSKNNKSPLDDYMLEILQSNKAQSKRAEDRSDRAIQLFMGLFTALFGAIAVINSNIQDVFQKYMFIGIALFIMCGFSILTFAWLTTANMFREEFAMERFHLVQYFHDQDPKVFERYGQSIYSLEPHRPFIFPEKSIDATSLAISLSLFALIVFSVLTASASIYLVLLAFSISGLFASIVVGFLVLIVLLYVWRVSQKRVEHARLASQKLLLEQNNRTGK